MKDKKKITIRIMQAVEIKKFENIQKRKKAKISRTTQDKSCIAISSFKKKGNRKKDEFLLSSWSAVCFPIGN